MLGYKILSDIGSGIPNLFIIKGSFVDHLKNSFEIFFYLW